MNKLAALATAASLAATAFVAAPVTGVAAEQPTVAAARSVNWHRCAEPSLRAFGARCGFVTVPRDYAHPHGKTIKIAVSRVRHTVAKSKYQGVLLVNPGGPGGSGLSLSVLGPIISQDFHRLDAGGAYDWIGFDPRGVGSSVPSVSCDDNYLGTNRPDYVPTTPALLRVWKSRSNGYARDCAKRCPRVARAHEDHRHGARHGPHPGSAGRSADQLLRLLLRHLSRRRSTQRCSRRGCAGWCSTATSTRDRSGIRPT